MAFHRTGCAFSTVVRIAADSESHTMTTSSPSIDWVNHRFSIEESSFSIEESLKNFHFLLMEKVPAPQQEIDLIKGDCTVKADRPQGRPLYRWWVCSIPTSLWQ